MELFLHTCINKLGSYSEFSGIFYKTKAEVALNAPPRSSQHHLLSVSGFLTVMVPRVFISARGIISKGSKDKDNYI